MGKDNAEKRVILDYYHKDEAAYPVNFICPFCGEWKRTTVRAMNFDGYTCTCGASIRKGIAKKKK